MWLDVIKEGARNDNCICIDIKTSSLERSHETYNEDVLPCNFWPNSRITSNQQPMVFAALSIGNFINAMVFPLAYAYS